MSIYVGAHRAKLCRGDWRPATLYKGEQYIAGAMDSEPAPLPCAIEDTYNDHVMLTALGKGRQECTTGKNLFNGIIYFGGIHMGRPYVVDFTPQTSPISIVSTFSGGVMIIECEPLTNYTVSTDYEGNEYTHFGFYENIDDVADYTKCMSYVVGATTPQTITSPQNCHVIVICYWSNAGASQEWSYGQVERGDTATGYEPYTGGMPSPNPEYPQPLVASGGSVSAHGKNLIQYPYESTTIYPQAEKGAILTAYAPYRGEPTQITLPTLRAIPDGSGGWTARDSMTPAPHMPGWYDVVRRVEAVAFDGTEDFVLCDTVSIKTADIHAIPENFPVTATNIKYSCSHCPQVDDYRYLTSYSPNNMSKALEFRNIVNMWGAEEYTVAAWQAFLAEQYAAKTPVTVWYVMAKPTTERVYLGELKSYPQYTYISANGDYLPDMTATARKEQI